MSVRHPADPAPPLGLLLTEPARGLWRMAGLAALSPVLAGAPRGDAHGVLVLPGLMATDASTVALRGFLRGLGHDVVGWALGRNFGPTARALDGMPAGLARLAERTGGPVSLVGWSLGGIFARELARERPELVRQVITLGSPFALTDPRQSWAGGTYRRFAAVHERVPTRAQVARPLPVPSTAVYSRRDGIVAWEACVAPESALHHNVEVRCGHLGFGVDPATLWAVADRLATPPGEQERFVPPPAIRALFPA
ncbi:esterase/lipase family protein [Pseudonocardia sp. CA-107938]|uniref:esterase/lipase family protein n=1 Tax=Pseudonocardia sp. CA-107938 TaxID=3240021 RepID=UPI003D8AB545